MNNKSDIPLLPVYFDKYINLVQEENLFDAFENSIEFLENIDLAKISSVQYKSYRAGKWTVNEVIQHIADVERVLSAGVLMFARGEKSHIIDFDEELLAKNSRANQKDLKMILDELIAVRKATFSLFDTFEQDEYQKTGINWKFEISVLAMGFNIIGHQIHHFDMIESNYLTL